MALESRIANIPKEKSSTASNYRKVWLRFIILFLDIELALDIAIAPLSFTPRCIERFEATVNCYKCIFNWSLISSFIIHQIRRSTPIDFSEKLEKYKVYYIILLRSEEKCILYFVFGSLIDNHYNDIRILWLKEATKKKWLIEVKLLLLPERLDVKPFSVKRLL